MTSRFISTIAEVFFLDPMTSFTDDRYLKNGLKVRITSAAMFPCSKFKKLNHFISEFFLHDEVMLKKCK